MKSMFVAMILILITAAPVWCESSVWIAKTDSSVMYLGGTIHLLRDSDRPFPPEFDRAYDASETIILETDFGKLLDPATQQAMIAKSMYTDGRTLDKVLSAEAYKKLSEFLSARGIPIAQMNNIKPSMIILTVMTLELQKMGVGEGIDAFYYQKATTDKKTIETLETIEEQIEIITSVGDGKESAVVIQNVEEIEGIGGIFEKMVAGWKNGDESILLYLLEKDLKLNFPKLHKMLVVDRNMK